MPVKIRVALAFVLGLLFVGTAEAIAEVALEEIVITVRSQEWGPGEVSVRRGQVVTWKWESGRHTIMIGEGPDDPKRAELATIDGDHPTVTWDAKETGKFHFYSAQRPELKVTVNVQSNTSVNQKTWGWLKKAFENPAARIRLD